MYVLLSIVPRIFYFTRVVTTCVHVFTYTSDCDICTVLYGDAEYKLITYLKMRFLPLENHIKCERASKIIYRVKRTPIVPRVTSITLLT